MSVQTALLIIDAQKAMFADQEPVANAETVISNLKFALEQARENHVPVLFVQHDDQFEGSPLQPGSPLWEIDDRIRPQEGEPVFHKEHPDSFQDTGLKAALDQAGITDLIIGGCQTEYCIDTSTRRAFSLGYHVTLLHDGHSTWNSPVMRAEQIVAHHNQVLGDFARLSSARDINWQELP